MDLPIANGKSSSDRSLCMFPGFLNAWYMNIFSVSRPDIYHVELGCFCTNVVDT